MTHSDPTVVPPAYNLSFTPTSKQLNNINTTTEILPVDPSSIHFTPSSPSTSHPYDSPSLTISCPSTKSALDQAAHILLHTQHPVAFPTETVYGLGANATYSPSVQSIFAAKNRPQDNPLIVHIASLRQLRALLQPIPNPISNPLSKPSAQASSIPEIYTPLIERFWPGPLTILLPLHPNTPLAANVTAGQTTFAVRLPNHPIALALSHLTNLPIAAPSANASGKPSPTTASHVYTDLHGRIPLILDGGAADVGVESTVVSGLCDPPRILRPGGVSLEQIRGCGGIWERCVAGSEGLKAVQNGHAGTTINGKSGQVDEKGEEIPLVPGMKYKHYSPKAKVILYEYGVRQPGVHDLLDSLQHRNRDEAAQGIVGVVRTRKWGSGWQENLQPGSGSRLRVEEIFLGTSGADISRGLFAALRELDDRRVEVIHVEGISEEDEGLAIMNRLRKAASEIVR